MAAARPAVDQLARTSMRSRSGCSARGRAAPPGQLARSGRPRSPGAHAAGWTKSPRRARRAGRDRQVGPAPRRHLLPGQRHRAMPPPSVSCRASPSPLARLRPPAGAIDHQRAGPAASWPSNTRVSGGASRTTTSSNQTVPVWLLRNRQYTKPLHRLVRKDHALAHLPIVGADGKRQRVPERTASVGMANVDVQTVVGVGFAGDVLGPAAAAEEDRPHQLLPELHRRHRPVGLARQRAVQAQDRPAGPAASTANPSPNGDQAGGAACDRVPAPEQRSAGTPAPPPGLPSRRAKLRFRRSEPPS